ncbi:MAG: hypothetical protein R3277_08995 [Brumimicrobium sp.]|nr:hypothetical protein [Brumimicrobium sp.]
MKIIRGVLLVPFLIPLIYCEGPSGYRNAAEALCLCMQNKDLKPGQDVYLSRQIAYSHCVLDVIKETGKDLKSDAFKEALKVYCPELWGLHEEFLDQ